ncbi:hypothetical protein, conserved [Leishmania tarentolae]|uniref:Uncharacterized protein n=1 Tax=Leishmania tarentolae TaxID=5689 RepID=A0A640KJF4_LEITA|nr:hypothetical protein, conserved [Leishmania tarentolae]
MDVSQFLKSFKKTVVSKAKPGSSVVPTNEVTNSGVEEDVTEVLHSASDSEAEREAQDEDVVLAGRADRMAGKRYAASTTHTKRNREFQSLEVVETNSLCAVETNRFQRQRATMVREARDTRKLPRAEMIASVRAELLRQREKLRSSEALDSTTQLDAPMQKMETTMIEVEDLLQASAPSAVTSASVLDFLPAAPLPLPHKSSPTKVLGAASTAAVPSEPQTSPSSVTNHMAFTATAKDTSTEEPAQLPKKKTKFELAMAMAHDDADS